MEMLAAETQQLKTLLPSDTYFCCEACGTIFETLEDIHYHIQTEHSQTLQDEVSTQVRNSGNGNLPQEEVIQIELPVATQEWIGTHNDPSPLKKQLVSAGTSVTIAEDSLPVIPSQLIEEIVSVPSTASGALSAGCLSSAQSHTYNNAEATAEETHAKQPSFDREAQLVAGNQVILNSSRLLPEGTKIKCTECSQRFKSVAEMKQHSETSHGIPYLICQLCGRCFSAFEQLASHVIEFHRKRRDKSWSKEEMIACGFVKETRMYPCSQCSKRCPSKAHLEQHLKWHEEKPNAMPKFMCHLCIPRVREFSSKTHLNRHIEQMHAAEDRALQAVARRAQARKTPSSSSSNSFAQGFTVADGLEVTQVTPVLRNGDNTERKLANQLNLPDVSDSIPSDKNDESEERELASAIERDLIVSNLMVRTSDTHMSCAVCLKKFQDQAILRKHITNKHLSGPNALPAVGSQTPNASVVYLDSSQTTDNQIPSTTASTTTIFQNSVTGVESTSSNTNMPELGEEYQLMYTNGEGAVVSLNGVDGGSSIQGQHYVEIQQSQQPENAIQFQWDVAPTELGQEVFLETDGSCQLVSVDVGVAGEEEVVLSSPVDMETSLKGGIPSQPIEGQQHHHGGLLYLSDQHVENVETAIELQPTQKQKRYQCPYCEESFKKFVRLQSHIQIRHPGDCSQAFEETTYKILQQQQQSSLDGSSQLFINAGEPAEVIIDENGVSSGQFYQMEVITSGQVQSSIPDRNSTPKASRGQRTAKLAQRTTYTIKSTSGSLTNPNRKDVNNFAVSNERPFLCQECGKAYKLRSHLAQHIRYHTGEKPFKCDICGQGFHLSGDRNRHVIKMHSDYRPHQCPYCPKGFVDRYALNNHMKLHMSEHSFKCEYCDEKFPSKALMKQHRVSHFF